MNFFDVHPQMIQVIVLVSVDFLPLQRIHEALTTRVVIRIGRSTHARNNGAWYGWHSFRRGLGTRLSDMGMSATNIQSILRHANISTTQGHYIFPN
jgi:integrase